MFYVVHHEQPCFSTALLERLPLQVILHLGDASSPFPLTSDVPSTFSLGILQRIALVLHVSTGVGIPDCRGVLELGSYVGRVRGVLGLNVTCWEVALEELPSARCIFTNFTNMWIKTKF